MVKQLKTFKTTTCKDYITRGSRIHTRQIVGKLSFLLMPKTGTALKFLSFFTPCAREIHCNGSYETYTIYPT